jgi:hypothetical protein
MNITEVELLISQWGAEPASPVRPVLVDRWTNGGPPGQSSPASLRALRMNPQIGWDFACRVVRSGRAWQPAKKKALPWIDAAVAHLHAERKSSAAQVKPGPFAQARELYESKVMGPVVKASLLAQDATAEVVATALNLEPDTIAAFDSLFFNVLDRRGDLEYINGLGLEDAPPAKAFPFEQAGVEPTRNFFSAAMALQVEDVLVNAGLKPRVELSTSNLVEGLQRKALSAAMAWADGDPGFKDTVPPLVSLGIEMAKKIEIQVGAEPTNESTTSFGTILMDQLREDRITLLAGVETDTNEVAVLTA